jgi:hypothetical protein
LTVRGRARHALVGPDNPRSLAGRARGRRWSLLAERFPDLASMRVLDLGGTASSWTLAPTRPARVVVVNTERGAGADGIETVVADACDLPAELRTGFDLVYSNSVIEHVGGHARRQAFAASVMGAAPHCWVQTPYRYFPIEPHWVFPGFQFLPTAMKVGVARRWRFGHRYAPQLSTRGRVGGVLSVELLDRHQLRYLFPDCDIVEERFVGLVKSIVAVR